VICHACAPPELLYMTGAAYSSTILLRPVPTIMRRDSTPQEHQCRPMDVTGSRGLVEIWIEMLAPPPQMAITPDISRVWPRPLPSIMRRISTPQERQFRPMNVACSRGLVEIWIEMLAAPQMATTPYISRISPRPLPTSMRQNITRQGHQCKPMDFTRSQDLVELWPNMWL
jgi:hypothetical protein